MTTTKSFERAELLAQFLFVRTGSVLSKWSGKLNKTEQELYLGAYFGRGVIHIDGQDESVKRTVSICFGRDYEDKNYSKWADLN